MFYSKFKKYRKHFKYSSVVDKKDLQAYARQYLKKENILTIYKTNRDYGIFTDKKIVLFDSEKQEKQIFIVPYKSISTIAICFREDSAELNLALESGLLVSLNFVEMSGEDKLRLRLLYVCIDKLINNQEPIAEDMKNLMSNNIKL